MSDDTSKRRVLLCATTTGYQTRMFDEAAARLGVELVLATDRCDRLDDPWRDRAVAVRFHDEPASLATLLEALRGVPLHGVLAVGDRPVPLAALVAAARGLPWHSVAGARASRDKRAFRARQRAAGLPAPWSTTVPAGATTPPVGVSYPCVVKPLVLSGSRGVIRADDPAALANALARVARAAGRARRAGTARRGRDPHPGRRLHRRRRVRARGAPRPRPSPRARDFRQARSAHRPVLRRNHLPDPDGPHPRPRPGHHPGRRPGGARGRPLARPGARGVPGDTGRGRSGPGGRGAADRRALCARRHLRRPRAVAGCRSNRCCWPMPPASPGRTGG